MAQGDVDAVLFFDPGVVLLSPVDDILGRGRLERENLVLTPHQTNPEQSTRAIVDNEICSLRHGIYNLGFIGVRNTAEGRCFADLWAARTDQFCRADTAAGLFTDQRWIDFAPVFFDGVDILKSSRHNVATWNVTTRRVEPCHRWISRERKDWQDAFADPFAAGGFLHWLKTRGPVEYPTLLRDDGRCIEADATLAQPPGQGCKWWLKRLLSPKTFLPNAVYASRRLAQGLQ